MLPAIPSQYRGVLTACLYRDNIHYDDLRAAFKLYGLKIKDIGDFQETMNDMGLGTGGETPGGYRTPLRLYTLTKLSLLMSITKEELEHADCFRPRDRWSHDGVKLTPFLQAFLAVRDGAEHVEVPFATENMDDTEGRRTVLPIVFEALTRLDDPGRFLKIIRKEDLADVMEVCLDARNCSRGMFRHPESVQQKLSAEWCLDNVELHDRIELLHGLMVFGRPRDRLARMCSLTSAYKVTEAVIALAEGFPKEALTCLRTAIERLPGSRRTFSSPFENFVLGMAYHQCCDNPEDRKEALKLFSSLESDWEDADVPLKLFLADLAGLDLANESAAKELKYAQKTSFISAWTAIAGKSLRPDLTIGDELEERASRCLSESPFLKREFLAVLNPDQESPALTEKLGVPALCTRIKPRPAWIRAVPRIFGARLKSLESQGFFLDSC